ncbi:hypothetical protein GCM10009677_00340 [Sphaerisporangium rubeum]
MIALLSFRRIVWCDVPMSTAAEEAGQSCGGSCRVGTTGRRTWRGLTALTLVIPLAVSVPSGEVLAGPRPPLPSAGTEPVVESVFIAYVRRRGGPPPDLAEILRHAGDSVATDSTGDPGGSQTRMFGPVRVDAASRVRSLFRELRRRAGPDTVERSRASE